MRLRIGLITGHKHLQGGKVVASKKLLCLAGRGVIRRDDKKSTPEKLKEKKNLKIALSVLNQENQPAGLWYATFDSTCETKIRLNRYLNCFFCCSQNRRKCSNPVNTADAGGEQVSFPTRRDSHVSAEVFSLSWSHVNAL